ncbi:hypothetical protein BGZ52_001912, partial [Haplosporangium bisporale]
RLQDNSVMPILQVDFEELEWLSHTAKVINFEPKLTVCGAVTIEPQIFQFGAVRAYVFISVSQASSGNDGSDRSSRSGQQFLKNGIKPMSIRPLKLHE